MVIKSQDTGMHGPIRVVRSSMLEQYRNMGPIYEWTSGDAYLFIDRIRFRERVGAILVYNNPPVHQVATPALHALIDGLDVVIGESGGLEFLILYDSNDPLHAGGDLKESLRNLEQTLESKDRMESEGAEPEEIDRLFGWGEARLQKGVALYKKIRNLADGMRVLAVCGGGMRYGGSAEIPLMADVLIGDERGGMCFSESMIGIIPGWAGIARVLAKAGRTNAEFMTKTAREVRAKELKAIGVYNELVHVPFQLPPLLKPREGDANQEKVFRYQLDLHNDRTGLILLPKALEYATCRSEEVPWIAERRRMILAGAKEIAREVETRANPYSYAHIWKMPLKEVKEEMKRLGRPLAPQSICALGNLFRGYTPSSFHEERFVEEELKADAALYRDPSFMEGLRAMLEQRVPDFRDASLGNGEQFIGMGKQWKGVQK